jgi:hypothetical protein
METPRSSFRLPRYTLERIAALQQAIRGDDRWRRVSKTDVIARAVDDLYRKLCPAPPAPVKPAPARKK